MKENVRQDIDDKPTFISLIISSVGDGYNATLGNICQKKRKGLKVSSTRNGRSKLVDEVSLYKGNVLNKLNISECLPFIYQFTNSVC